MVKGSQRKSKGSKEVVRLKRRESGQAQTDGSEPTVFNGGHQQFERSGRVIQRTRVEWRRKEGGRGGRGGRRGLPWASPWWWAGYVPL